MRLGLAARLLLATAVLAVVVAAAVLGLIGGTAALHEANAKGAQSRLALAAATQVEKDVLDLETGVRGFVITRDERFLQPWREARRRLARDLADLRRQMRGDRERRALAASIAAASVSYLRGYTRPVLASARARRPRAASRTTTALGKLRVDGLRRLIDRVSAQENAETARLTRQAEATARHATHLGVGALGGSTALILLFGVYLTRGAVAPIRSVGSAADRLAAGDPTARAPESGAPELAQLGRSFNRMASAIEDNRAALQASNVELTVAKDEAERANHAKTEFMSRMSHELRTPLNAILGFAQLLELEELHARQRDSVEHVLRAGRHLLALIDEVLDIARVEARELRISPEPVAARELVEETLALVEPLAARRSIRLETDLGESAEAHVMADRQRLKQVLLNLLSNAIKYNREAGQVAVSLRRRDGERLAILVRDTGPGIAPAQLLKLFEPFERLGAERANIAGTGLGLALSRRLAEAMGGSLVAQSEPGAGSTLCIELALAAAPEPAEAAVRHTAERALGSRKILYIEDNLSNLRLVERVLEPHPEVTFLPAMQGELGLELAREHHPDMVLLDLHLPDLPGYEVLLRLKAEPALQDTPVVILSADATPGEIRRLREAGAHDYLTKPIDVRKLLHVVEGYFE